MLDSGAEGPTVGFMTHVTCRLTTKNRDQLRNPSVLEYGLPLLFYIQQMWPQALCFQVVRLSVHACMRASFVQRQGTPRPACVHGYNRLIMLAFSGHFKAR